MSNSAEGDWQPAVDVEEAYKFETDIPSELLPVYDGHIIVDWKTKRCLCGCYDGAPVTCGLMMGSGGQKDQDCKNIGMNEQFNKWMNQTPTDNVKAMLAAYSAPAPKRPSLTADLAAVLNAHSAENGSDTPDFILADFLLSVLLSWNRAVKDRQIWYSKSEEKSVSQIAKELEEAKAAIATLRQENQDLMRRIAQPVNLSSFRTKIPE